MTAFNEIAIRRFASPREGSGLWASKTALLNAWRGHDFATVMPLTLEFAPSLACNLSCSECPYCAARLKSRLRRIKRAEFATPDDTSVMSLELAKVVFRKARDAGVEGVVVSGGGEPLVCPHIPEMLKYSAQLGMVNGLYTNAIQLGAHPNLASELLVPESNLAFVRPSLNVIRPETGRRFAGASPEDIAAQYEGFAALLKARDRLIPRYRALAQRPPAVQVSVISDDRNIGALSYICERVAGIAKDRDVVEPNDDFLVRPLTKHCRACYSTSDHDEFLIRQILQSVGDGGAGYQQLTGARFNPRLGFGLDKIRRGTANSYSEVLRSEWGSRDYCWANGLFLTVGPDARVRLCTDRNCCGEWAIGDLKRESVAEIYAGSKRRDLLAAVHKVRCGPGVCEATCRTVRLNQIARAVQNGDLTNTGLAEIRLRESGARPLLLS